MSNHVFTDVDDRTVYTEFHHNNCGKVWTEPPDDHLPSYCPGCGRRIFEDRDVEYTDHEAK